MNLEEDHIVANTLPKSEEEASGMAAHQNVSGPTGSRSCKVYLNDYLMVGPYKAAKALEETA